MSGHIFSYLKCRAHSPSHAYLVVTMVTVVMVTAVALLLVEPDAAQQGHAQQRVLEAAQQAQ